MSGPIYLDYNATTPLDHRVLTAMMPYLTDRFGNAASKHLYGETAFDAVETSRDTICELLGDKPISGRLIFTSGATESNNLALMSFARTHARRGIGVRIITSAIEHKCILSTCRHLAADNGIVILPVDKMGFVDPDYLDSVLRETPHVPTLVSVMTTNNEVGTVQDIKRLAEVTYSRGAFFHTDAAQALGKIRFDVKDLGIDMVSMSAHKFYGPKGVGALWVKDTNLLRTPVLHGGGQEYGLRSGTANVPGIVGMCSALALAQKELDDEILRLTSMRRDMINIFSELEEVKLNGHEMIRQPGNINISFKFVDSAMLIHEIERDVSISAGSACTSANVEPSHVLKAMSLSEEEIKSAVRICLGRQTKTEEAVECAQIIRDAVLRLRDRSELWRIHKMFTR